MSVAMMTPATATGNGFMERIQLAESGAVQYRQLWNRDARMNEGFSLVNNRQSQDDKALLKAVTEVKRFMNGLKSGRIHSYLFQEAMGSDDFPNLLGNVLGREMVGNYQAYPKTYEKIAEIGEVKDFRTKELYELNGLRGLMTEVGPQTKPKVASYTETPHSIKALIWALEALIDWRALVNDDLGAFNRIPMDLGISAGRTEQWLATSKYVDASGPHASVYTSGNTNIITGNPELSMEALKLAEGLLRNQRDSDNQPVLIQGMVLEVPPLLYSLAMDLTRAFQVELRKEANTNNTLGTANALTGQNVMTTNWLAQGIEVVQNPYIPYIASTANGNTTWFLHAKKDSSRPFLKLDFLRGFNRQPALLRKKADTEAVFGSLPAGFGNFDSMGGHHYRLLHAMGASIIDPKMSMGSNGSNS